MWFIYLQNPLSATDKRGRSALHHAIGANQHAGLRVLLEADPGLATLQDIDGRNVLHLATVAGEVELIRELIKYVDVDSTDNEKHTAVHFATGKLCFISHYEFTIGF